MIVYLDWNIFSSLSSRSTFLPDSKDKILFEAIHKKLADNRSDLVIPYSSAHLQDLYKNYAKGEIERVKVSLAFIKELTESVCLAQYWNEGSAKLHRRDPIEFFNSIVTDEEENIFGSFDGLLALLKEGGHENMFDQHKTKPHNINFEQIDKQEHNFFASLLTNARQENTEYALIKDIFNLHSIIRNNPTVYNNLKKELKAFVPIDPHIGNHPNIIEQLDSNLSKSLLNKSFTELYSENNKRNYTKNGTYELITGIYMQLDYLGYKSEKLDLKNSYDNLFNDALHCFFSAHSDIYITRDKSNYHKTKAVFKELSIKTKVLFPDEFIAD